MTEPAYRDNFQEDKLQYLTDTMVRFLQRLDGEAAARDAQVARLERRIEQIAAKTGVKLEY